MNEVAPYLWDPPVVDPCNVAYLANPDVWDTMPDEIKAIIKEGVLHLDMWNETIRTSGESYRRVDGSFEQICFLDDEAVETLIAHSMDYLQNEVAARSARAAEAVNIILAYRAEKDYSGWQGDPERGTVQSGSMPGIEQSPWWGKDPWTDWEFVPELDKGQ